MERCTNETPPLVEIQGTDRSVACWLHVGDPAVAVPVELSRVATGATTVDPAKDVTR
jgi:hypothetical protein